MSRSYKKKATLRRTLRNKRRNTIRGGGYATTSSLTQFNPANDTQFAIKTPVYQSYNDCYAQSRPGQLVNPAAPELAQTVMAGGGCGCGWRGGRRRSRRSRAQRGGATCGMRGGATCGMRGGATCGMRGGATCGMRGGASNGFGVHPEMSVGGNGPIAAPAYVGVPCDGRAGFPNPNNPQIVNPDIRAPADIYSLTANMPAQKGGSGNGFSANCYRAPNSMIPVYPAESAGFHFRPSTEAGSTLPDGVTAYNNVVPQAARLGGARRITRRRR